MEGISGRFRFLMGASEKSVAVTAKWNIYFKLERC